MYFSDEVILFFQEYEKDELGQIVAKPSEGRSVFADIRSVSAREFEAVGQLGYKAEACVVVHLDDYINEDMVQITEQNPIIHTGTYPVYRKFIKGDCIELYIKSEATNG